MQLLYSCGYSGHQPGQLHRQLIDLDALLCDVRLSARSRVPGWNRGNLEQLLGDRYIHLPEWGNLRYKLGPPIEIKDFAAGLPIIEASTRVPVLLCVCKDAATCHRTVLADRLRGIGWVVSELEWNETAAPETAQLTLPIASDGGDR